MLNGLEVVRNNAGGRLHRKWIWNTPSMVERTGTYWRQGLLSIETAEQHSRGLQAKRQPATMACFGCGEFQWSHCWVNLRTS